MAANHHATAVVLRDRGVLIQGPSGSGKSLLALKMLHYCSVSGHFSRLVADDQLLLDNRNGRLVAQAPGPICGLIEARSVGPVPIGFVDRAVIDLVVQLVAEIDAPRLDAMDKTKIAGATLPCLVLPEKQAERGVMAIVARLSMPPFAAAPTPI